MHEKENNMQNSPDAQASGGKVRDIKSSEDASANWSNDAAQFRKKLSALESDLKDLTKISRSLAGDTLGILKSNAGEYYTQGVEKAKSLEQDLELRIKESPIKALLVAIGLGFLVGLILRRR